MTKNTTVAYAAKSMSSLSHKKEENAEGRHAGVASKFAQTGIKVKCFLSRTGSALAVMEPRGSVPLASALPLISTRPQVAVTPRQSTLVEPVIRLRVPKLFLREVTMLT